jgi:hypothetical protein
MTAELPRGPIPTTDPKPDVPKPIPPQPPIGDPPAGDVHDPMEPAPID